MLLTRQINGHEIIGWARTPDSDFPEAVICRSPKEALGADEHPYVVWPVDQHGQSGNGQYCGDLAEAMRTLAELAADPN